MGGWRRMLNSETSADQAAGLRRIVKPRPVRVIAVTSGKGGVGKTNVSVNLALALAQRDKKVMLMDADLGLANVDVLLGLRPSYNLSHVLDGERSLEEIIVVGPDGLRIVPASSGARSMMDLDPMQHAGIIRAFSELSEQLDILLIDTGAGISNSVVSYTRAAQEVIVVVCDEPASITDAYALMKVLHREHGIQNFHILANMTHAMQEGRELFAKISKVTDRFLDVALDFMGAVPYDDYVRKAVQRQRAVVDLFPRSKAALAFKNLAHKTDTWPMPTAASGHMEFFVERLIRTPPATVDFASRPEPVARLVV